jgi:hypothetical protein
MLTLAVTCILLFDLRLLLRFTYFAKYFEMIQLAEDIHRCLSNGADSHQILDFYNEIKDKNTLAAMNKIFMEKYDYSVSEAISEKFEVKELYAISSTLKYIREPNAKNKKIRDKFYEEIGFSPDKRE